MPKANSPEDWNFDDCHYSSKFCYDKPDGTSVCPIDLRKCVDGCSQQYSS